MDWHFLRKFDPKWLQYILIPLGIAILLVLFTPHDPADVYKRPEEITADDIMPKGENEEIDQLKITLEELRQRDIYLIDNNYPASMSFKWMGGQLDTSPRDMADLIAYKVWKSSKKSVHIVVEINGSKYSSKYNP